MIKFKQFAKCGWKKTSEKLFPIIFFHCHLVRLMKITILVEFTTIFIYFDFRQLYFNKQFFTLVDKRHGKYPSLTTKAEANSCFSYFYGKAARQRSALFFSRCVSGCYSVIAHSGRYPNCCVFSRLVHPQLRCKLQKI